MKSSLQKAITRKIEHKRSSEKDSTAASPEIDFLSSIFTEFKTNSKKEE
jgi:hypothetical protein